MVSSFVIPDLFSYQSDKVFHDRSIPLAIQRWQKIRPNAWVRFVSPGFSDFDLFFYSDGSYSELSLT